MADLKVHASAGFTLLESLIAFLIAAGGLAAIYSSQATSLQGREKAQSRLQAILVAEDVLTQTGIAYPLAESTIEGKSGTVSWSLQISAEEAVGEIPLTGLWRVTVVARATNGSAVSLETLRFQPDAS